METEKLSLESQIVGWLAKEGYRLEYQTHHAFNAAGLDAVMSHYVTNADGKPREIDVSASVSDFQKKPPIVVRVLCECKYSAGTPWVLLQSDLEANLLADWHGLPKAPQIHS